MNKLDYIGHPFQLSGVEEYELTRAKAKGMKIWHVKNGTGLEMYISLDRGFDIIALTCSGINVSYLSPNGYVAPSFYDDKKDGFLKSFSAGFLTTCGLTQVGSFNRDLGEDLPLHGTYSNIPASNYSYEENETAIVLKGEITDETIFSHKLVLFRTIEISKQDNTFQIEDKILNRGDKKTPLSVLYHFNIGYPLLSESAKLYIDSDAVTGRNEYAQKEIDSLNRIAHPTSGWTERCYYHRFQKKQAHAGIYNASIDKGILLNFDSGILDCFTQWNMFGIRDYVLGLEPGNATPDGRNYLREHQKLKFIHPGETQTFKIKISLIDNQQQMEEMIDAD